MISASNLKTKECIHERKHTHLDFGVSFPNVAIWRQKFVVGLPLFHTNFFISAPIWRHKRIHTGEKLEKIDDFSASFIQALNLKTTERVHWGEKLYMCVDYVFKTNSDDTQENTYCKETLEVMIFGISFTSASNLRTQNNTYIREALQMWWFWCIS